MSGWGSGVGSGFAGKLAHGSNRVFTLIKQADARLQALPYEIPLRIAAKKLPAIKQSCAENLEIIQALSEEWKRNERLENPDAFDAWLERQQLRKDEITFEKAQDVGDAGRLMILAREMERIDKKLAPEEKISLAPLQASVALQYKSFERKFLIDQLNVLADNKMPPSFSADAVVAFCNTAATRLLTAKLRRGASEKEPSTHPR